MTENMIEEPVSIVTDRELALIRCLKSQFPSARHLLCRWHVNINVLAKTKKWFPAPVKVNGKAVHHPQFQEFIVSWNLLLASSTESIYTCRLAAVTSKYPAGAVKYCTDTWLIWKEALVAYYIDQRPHFGVTVTSPIEGCHATLKGYLQRGHGDLRGVFNRLRLFWTAQHASITTAIAQQQGKPKHTANVTFFAAVLQYIHSYAVQKMVQEDAKLPAQGVAPITSCTCLIRQSMGLPCYHTIWQKKQANSVIQLEDIHPHWYLVRPDPGTPSTLVISHPLPVLNPLVIQGRGRPRGALGGVIRPTTTRREPSAFEIPSSTAPPAFNRPAEPLFIVNSGLTRIDQGHQDLYEPGTQLERGYMQGLSSVYQFDSTQDAASIAALAIEAMGEVE
jgi:hypothetical protein